MTGINPSSYVVNMSKNSAIQHTQTQKKGKTELKAHTHIYSIFSRVTIYEVDFINSFNQSCRL